MISELRREYASRSLSEADTDPDPITQFRVWFDEALKSRVLDANAMSLATASPAGAPSVRTVLLKDVDRDGFVFYTRYDSPKGRDLALNPRAALLFYWAELERQVRITGAVTRVPREMSEAYFATRPVESRWAAWAARQSSELATRDALERQFVEIKRRYANQMVPCPPDWGGYRVAAERMEFWQGRPSRLHDRLLYARQPDGSWTRVRLAP
ncbi:MAG TPA: pyridoxamine 5'-phosphate oxidase [Vicinamibacterales bacterium]|nr:pyridoxamine 5'-phosphate oxidase [Vicinamibacterales bacterium]